MLCEHKLPNIALNHCNAVNVEQKSSKGNNFCTILPATVFYNAAVSKQESEQELENPSKNESLTRSSLTNNFFPLSSPSAISTIQFSRQNIKRRSTMTCNENMRRISMQSRSKSLVRAERKNSKMYDADKNQTTQIEMRKFQSVLEEMKKAEKYFMPKLHICDNTAVQSNNNTIANNNNSNADNKFKKTKTYSQTRNEYKNDVHTCSEKNCVGKNTNFIALSEQTARGVAELAKDKLENSFVNHILGDKISESEFNLCKVRNARTISVHNVENEEQQRLLAEELTEELYSDVRNERCQATSPNDEIITAEIVTSRNNKFSKNKSKIIKNSYHHINDNNKSQETIALEGKELCQLRKPRYSHVHIIEGMQRSNNELEKYKKEEESISWNGSQQFKDKHAQQDQRNNDTSEHSSKHNLLSDTNEYDLNNAVHTENGSTQSKITHSALLREHQLDVINHNNKSCETDEQMNRDHGTGEVALLSENISAYDRLNKLLQIINQERTYVLPQWCDREIKLRCNKACKKDDNTTQFTEGKKLGSVLPKIKCKTQMHEHNDAMSNKQTCMPKRTAVSQESSCRKLVECNKWRGLGRRSNQELQNRLFRIREHEWLSERDAAITFEKTVQVLRKLRPLRQQMLYNDVLMHYQVRPIEQWDSPIALVKDKENASHCTELQTLSLLDDNTVVNNNTNIDCIDNTEKQEEQPYSDSTAIKRDNLEKEGTIGREVLLTKGSHKFNTISTKEPATKFINTQHLIHAHSRNIFAAAAHIEHSRKTAAQEMYIHLLHAESDKLLLTNHNSYQRKVTATNNLHKQEESLEKKWKPNEGQHYEELEEEEEEENNTHGWEEMTFVNVKQDKRFDIHHELTNLLDRCLHILVNSTTHAKSGLSTFRQIMEESNLTAEDILVRPVLSVLEKLSKLFQVTNEEFRRWIARIEQEVVSTNDYASRFRQTDVEIFGQALTEMESCV